MKKNHLFILATIIVFSFASCKTEVENPLKGTWRALNRGNNEQLKHFTDTYFSWSAADLSGNIVTAAMGKYKMKSDTTYIEYIEQGAPPMKRWINTKADINYKIKGDTLIVVTKMEDMEPFSETWVRVK